ncbi:uncharacterized protein BHQ10_009347 [Talaromyces amestolkiae]|uniref:Uncharacterized protein n=1 Tax=Talaromyces amestolkiae TaxID=1196081 RepID=A0A364LBX9_TALAM|nr:uncharacterized protein BHQ10_009347 [Talaromyces amestolkiae]RAO73335.1 hypothetical protein BHQ10_009347 [Talaromyces amestolkiae]
MIGFLDLPGEIRNLIYDHLLAFEGPIAFWAKNNSLPVNLLYVNNKTIYREFSSLFYSRITFDFSSRGPDCEGRQCCACLTKKTTSFLDQIGQNARYIQCIEIDFPSLNLEEDEHWCEALISEYSLEVVNKIASSCPDLKHLILGPNHTLNALLDLAVMEPDETFELLHRVDRCIHRIRSLDLMIWVRIPGCEEFSELIEDMESIFDWNVDVIDPIDFEWMTDEEEDEQDDEDEDDSDNDDDASDDFEASDNDESADHNRDGEDNGQNDEKNEIGNEREEP